MSRINGVPVPGVPSTPIRRRTGQGGCGWAVFLAMAVLGAVIGFIALRQGGAP